MYLEKINSPSDIKSYSLDEMKELAKEMRTALLKKLSIHGGHCGPNFGMVEATIALHYVFNSPVDKFVFDVSHQTYPHKMLTVFLMKAAMTISLAIAHLRKANTIFSP